MKRQFLHMGKLKSLKYIEVQFCGWPVIYPTQVTVSSLLMSISLVRTRKGYHSQGQKNALPRSPGSRKLPHLHSLVSTQTHTLQKHRHQIIQGRVFH